MVFDLAISLGVNCQPRYQISRILHQRQNQNPEEFRLGDSHVVDYGTHFFDWNVTPLWSVISILNHDFAGVLELENLQIMQFGNKQSVIDRAYGSKYSHVFPGTETGSCTEEKLKNSYEEIKAKYNYLVEKTRRALRSEKNILFVLAGNSTEQAVLRLRGELDSCTSHYRILFTPYINKPGYLQTYPQLEKDGHFIIRPMLNTGYPGHIESWDRAFEGIELKMP